MSSQSQIKNTTENEQQEFTSTITSSIFDQPDNTNKNNFTITLIRSADGIAVEQIAVDEMQLKLYVVRDKNSLIRCANFKNCDLNVTVLTTNSQNVKYIAVDSWNGYVHFLT